MAPNYVTYLIHRVEDVLLRRGVHEVELEEVLHTERLEEQHHVGQVGPLECNAKEAISALISFQCQCFV